MSGYSILQTSSALQWEASSLDYLYLAMIDGEIYKIFVFLQYVYGETLQKFTDTNTEIS